MYTVQNGIYNLDFRLSKIEKTILDDVCDYLEKQGFNYLSVPTSITSDTFFKQEAATDSWILDTKDRQFLGGSAEQGILEYFTNKTVETMKIYSRNTCFRKEDKYEDLIRVKEFTKIEQYIFCEERDWVRAFELLLHGGAYILKKLGIEYRFRDVTQQDKGYHLKKVDIEVLTKKYGWMETHSCTYFGTEQSKRYNINGSNHTLSCTGIATPRVLIPLIEQMEGK